MTRADVLKHALSFTLSKLRFKRAPLGIPEHERWKLAGDAVDELRKFGHWKELDEPAGLVPTAPSSLPGPSETG